MEKIIGSHIKNEKKKQIKRRTQDHKDCLDLIKKMEYAINNPISKSKFICQINRPFYPFFQQTILLSIR